MESRCGEGKSRRSLKQQSKFGSIDRKPAGEESQATMLPGKTAVYFRKPPTGNVDPKKLNQGNCGLVLGNSVDLQLRRSQISLRALIAAVEITPRRVTSSLSQTLL
ncbi:uncharacterized protein N7483_006979 [Penicillium malachiteum]|uniref:uncharacterized protein n=1 Tax=Penicillium malachiteum TaxID=1324776 RepID=UPI00254908FB|nr:uncharacterized protein N7483_006979 [Penicillium malachiteum]KAJ5725622.1 hypothetical protein N7483_006979 [Penicillium malachiteum]